MKYYRIVSYIIIIFFSICFSKTIAQTSDTLVYSIDTNSFLKWQCDKHYGVVPIKNGTLKVFNHNIIAGNFIINMDSLKDMDITYPLMRKTLYNTLTSQFFFDVKKYHTACFNIDYVKPLKKNKYLITGDLWIKNLVNCINFTSKIVFYKNYLKATSDTFFIDRTKWGITIYSQHEANSDDSVIVSDEIYFTVHLSGKLKVKKR